MLTFSDLLLKIMLPLAGLLLGASAGQAYFHWLGAVLGAFVGFGLSVYLGLQLNRAYIFSVARHTRQSWARLSTDELRQQLATSFTPNFILLELKRRGEDISEDVATILALLEAEESFRRIRGWAALLSAFPEFASMINNYNPTRPAAECRTKVAELRRFIETSSLHPA